MCVCVCTTNKERKTETYPETPFKEPTRAQGTQPHRAATLRRAQRERARRAPIERLHENVICFFVCTA